MKVCRRCNRMRSSSSKSASEKLDARTRPDIASTFLCAGLRKSGQKSKSRPAEESGACASINRRRERIPSRTSAVARRMASLRDLSDGKLRRRWIWLDSATSLAFPTSAGPSTPAAFTEGPTGKGEKGAEMGRRGTKCSAASAPSIAPWHADAVGLRVGAH